MSGKQLEGKVALITGGTTGIGFATAKLFADEGANVTVTGRNPETLEVARRELAGRVEVVAADAGDGARMGEVLAAIAAKHGGIDVLFLNAGIAKFAPLGQLPEAAFDEMFRVNVKGPWLTIAAALPYLRKGASVLVNTSAAGVKGLETTSAYAATKAALRSIVRTAAAELAPRGIRVNAVSPGPIETPILGKVGMTQEAMGGFIAASPMKRFGKPEEVAATALFLASEGSTYITGAEIPVDGGFASL